MPLVRYAVRNEYALGAPEMYTAADTEDPKAVLGGVAVAGLVGLLRQLGDLAEFAGEVFHGLQEQVVSTASRSRKLMARVQRVEAALPSLEKAVLSQTSHIHFSYTPGHEWHPRIRNEQNHFIFDDLPHFIMDSYEECREPPRLQLLDKFDTGGPGSCLKRYSDPTFFRRASAGPEVVNTEKSQLERKARKLKKKRSRQRSGQFPYGLSMFKESARGQLSSPTGQRRSSSAQTGSTCDIRFKSDMGAQSDSTGSRDGMGSVECVVHPGTLVQPYDPRTKALSSGSEEHISNSHNSGPVEQTAVADNDIPCNSLPQKAPHISSDSWDEKTEIVERKGVNSEINDIQYDMIFDLHRLELEPVNVEAVDVLDDLSERGNTPKSVIEGNSIMDPTKRDSEIHEIQDVLHTKLDLREQELNPSSTETAVPIAALPDGSSTERSTLEGHTMRDRASQNSEIHEVQNLIEENFDLHQQEFETVNVKISSQIDAPFVGGNTLNSNFEGNQVDDTGSETDYYVDALNTIESESDTDFECPARQGVESNLICRDDLAESTIVDQKGPSIDYHLQEPESQSSSALLDHLDGVLALNGIESESDTNFESQTIQKVEPYLMWKDELEEGGIVDQKEPHTEYHPPELGPQSPTASLNHFDTTLALNTVESESNNDYECRLTQDLQPYTQYKDEPEEGAVVDQKEQRTEFNPPELESRSPSTLLRLSDRVLENIQDSSSILSANVEYLQHAQPPCTVSDRLCQKLHDSISSPSMPNDQYIHRIPSSSIPVIPLGIDNCVRSDDINGARLESAAREFVSSGLNIANTQAPVNETTIHSSDDTEDATVGFSSTASVTNGSSLESGVHEFVSSGLNTQAPVNEAIVCSSDGSEDVIFGSSSFASIANGSRLESAAREFVSSGLNIANTQAPVNEMTIHSSDATEDATVPFSSIASVTNGSSLECGVREFVSYGLNTLAPVNEATVCSSDGSEDATVGSSSSASIANGSRLESSVRGFVSSSSNINNIQDPINEGTNHSSDRRPEDVIVGSSGSASVANGSRLESSMREFESSSSIINNAKAPVNEAKVCPSHRSEDATVGSSSSASVTFWTNGGLLGLQPSKPPDFGVSSTVGVAPAHSNTDTAGASKQDTRLKGDGRVEKVASSVKNFDFSDSNLSSNKPYSVDENHYAVSTKELSRQLLHSVSDGKLDVSAVQQSNRSDHSKGHCLNTNDAVLRETGLPVGADVKPAASDAANPSEERSSLLSGLGRGILINGFRRTKSLGYNTEPKTSSPVKAHEFENGHCASMSHPAPQINMKEKLDSPVNSPPPSPPLEHMKISFQPVDSFETSRLKLKYPEEGIDCDEGIIDAFPSFQLVPEHMNLQHEIGLDSDDDTFCRSYTSMSDDSASDPSDSYSEQWESGDVSEGNDHMLYDNLRGDASMESTSGSTEHEVTSRGNRCTDTGHTNMAQQSSLDFPILDSKNPFLSEERPSSIPKAEVSSHSQEPSPQLPPLPPLEWRVSKSPSDLSDGKLEDSLSNGPNRMFDPKLPASTISLVDKLDSAKPLSKTEEIRVDTEKFDDEKETKIALNGRREDDKDDFLQQIRTKSFNLRRAEKPQPLLAPGPATNFRVTAILQKASAIRKAVGSDDGDDDDTWSDTS